jgi:SET domain-containing protein
MSHPYLEIRTIPNKGRGVFARKDFVPGEVIEHAPVIVGRAEEWEALEKTALADHYFLWGEEETLDQICVVLGYGSLYNHSYAPNADWDRDLEKREMVFYAVEPIAIGQEITINYNGIEDAPVWFDVHE